MTPACPAPTCAVCGEPVEAACTSRKIPSLRAGGRTGSARGGSWNPDAWITRCARCFSRPACFSGPGLGFRLVLIPNRAESR